MAATYRGASRPDDGYPRISRGTLWGDKRCVEGWWGVVGERMQKGVGQLAVGKGDANTHTKVDCHRGAEKTSGSS